MTMSVRTSSRLQTVSRAVSVCELIIIHGDVFKNKFQKDTLTLFCGIFIYPNLPNFQLMFIWDFYRSSLKNGPANMSFWVIFCLMSTLVQTMRHETNNVRSHPRGDPISTTFYNPFIHVIKSHLIKQLNFQCSILGLICLNPNL